MLINVDFIYPVGCLFITTDTTFNPNITFGGTWARLEGDVYLKNVPSTSGQPIGNYGGTSSDHKIPIASIPSHNHSFDKNANPAFETVYISGNSTSGMMSQASGYGLTSGYSSIGYTGGGQAYYPYYYGIICWHRTA